MSYQRKLSAGKINLSEQWRIAELVQNVQRVLLPVQVRNPYAEHLQIPYEVFKPRRSNAHYLAFIEAVTFYHQYQREKQYDKGTGEEYIETTLEDIEEANQLMKGVLIRKSDDLTGACRNYFERLKDWLKKEDKNTFTNREVRQALRVNASNQKRYMVELQTGYYLRKSKGNQAQGFRYEIISMEEYEQLKQGITGILDDMLKKLRGKGKSKVQ